VGPFEYELTELTGTPYPISIDFKLACNVLGNHNISASVVAALDQQWVEDPIDTNDAIILTDNVPVTAEADLQIEMLDLNCETPALPYTPFKCQADVTIINGGPYHPANADLAVTLSGPDTCSLTSGPATQIKHNITLGNQSQLIELVWQASCSAGTFWPASAVAELTVDQAYVSDPEPESNILEYVSLNILTHPKLGLVDVSIFSVPDYIVTKRLDWNSFTFGRTGYEHSLIGCSSVDINGDRLVDLQCQFSGSATGLDPETYELGMLRGWSQDGAAVIGRDNMPDSSGKPQKR
jgi:hypothetical protein